MIKLSMFWNILWRLFLTSKTKADKVVNVKTHLWHADLAKGQFDW